MQIGAQLYTLREYLQNEKDMGRSLEKVAAIGYKTVQVSGLGPFEPKKLRALCDSLGLKIVITHTPQGRVLNETDAVIEEHNVMGCDYIGIGSLPGKYCSPHWFGYFLEDYANAIEKIKASGKLFMYHNHAFEFIKLPGGGNYIDRMNEKFGDNIGFTLDTYWAQAAGCDVIDLIKKLSGKLPCVHLKDMAVNGDNGHIMAPVGEGNLNFKGICKALVEAGTKYALVEQDTCQKDPFECLKDSYNNLKELGYA